MKKTEAIVTFYIIALTIVILAMLFRAIDLSMAAVVLVASTLMLAVYLSYPFFARNWNQYNAQKAMPNLAHTTSLWEATAGAPEPLPNSNFKQIDSTFAPPEAESLENSEAIDDADKAGPNTSDDQEVQTPSDTDWATLSAGIRIERRFKRAAKEALERLVRDWTRAWLSNPNNPKSPFEKLLVQWVEDDNLVIEGQGEEKEIAYLIFLRPTYLDDVMKIEAVAVDWKTQPKIDTFVECFLDDLLQYLNQWLGRDTPTARSGVTPASETDEMRVEQPAECALDSASNSGELMPWEKILDIRWDRCVLKEWLAGYSCPEIAERTGLSADRIRNRLSELRQEYGEQIVPTDLHRKVLKVKKTRK